MNFAIFGIGNAGGAAVMGFFLYMVAFMDTIATIPTRVDGRAVEVEVVRRVGLLLRGHLLPVAVSATLGDGRT